MGLNRLRGARHRLRSARRRRSRGMAMVEMIFVLPLLLLLVFAIAEFGLMFSRWLTLSNAVREGARELVVFRNPCAGAADDARDAVIDYAAAGGLQLSAGDIEITGDCAGSGTAATVRADFDFELSIPFAPSLGTIPLTYTSQMRNE